MKNKTRQNMLKIMVIFVAFIFIFSTVIEFIMVK
jgi:hypothetical protein